MRTSYSRADPDAREGGGGSRLRKSKFTDEQIAMALRQAKGGTPAAEICRKMEVTEATFYRWKKMFGGLGVIRSASTVPQQSSGASLRYLA
jgi:DNA invertase Pin-like site-specific DNA recombinase